MKERCSLVCDHHTKIIFSINFYLHTLKYFGFFFLDFIYLLLEERERNIDWLPLTCPQLGTWPAAQTCALTRNQTSHLLIRRLVLNPLSYTSQGFIKIFLKTNT